MDFFTRTIKTEFTYGELIEIRSGLMDRVDYLETLPAIAEERGLLTDYPENDMKKFKRNIEKVERLRAKVEKYLDDYILGLPCKD